jgi:starvation-inducible DNA-binding protein
MKTIDVIGLNAQKSQQVAESLNQLLANFQVYYQNLRGFHWNVKGNRFFVLHAKFEELYNDAVEKVDELAERILTLGHTPLHSYAAYARVASLKAVENVSDGDACLQAVLIRQEREIIALASEAGDDGTQDLLTPYISQQEKLVWMLCAYLNK